MASNGGHLDPQGSMWRRWDPHVHVPGTLMNDQFEGISVADALNELAAKQPYIEAIGVTDYMTTASYRRALEAWHGGAGRSIKLLFPNVELRLDVPTTRGAAVNLHLLCAPDQVDELDRFIASLEFFWANRKYRGDEDGLIALGRAFSKDANLERSAALRIGVTQFKVSFQDLYSEFQVDGWARDHCLVAAAGGQSDGTSGVRTKDGAFAARRESIEGLANMIFSSNPQQTDFWLGRGDRKVAELVEIYGGPKPCLHGSDAHNTATLGTPQQGRYTWLKGDATFETLRMACIAPDSRCHVGLLPPSEADAHGRITRIELNKADWFGEGNLPINPGLVAIIGARGSGKTALADLIAVGAGSGQPFHNPASFMQRARALLGDCTAAVQWSQGEVTEWQGEEFRADDEQQGVRYLSQQFVESLCAVDGVSDDLLVEIERVVFNAWPIDEREGAVDFQEFIGFRLQGARNRQGAERDEIARISQAFIEQQTLQESLAQKNAERTQEQATLRRLEAQIRGLLNTKTGGDTGRLTVVGGILEKRELELRTAERRVTQLTALVQAVQSHRDVTFPGITETLRNAHERAGLSEEEWQAFRVDFVGDVTDILERTLSAARLLRADLAGRPPADGNKIVLDKLTAEELAVQSVAALRADRERLQRLVGLDTQRARQMSNLTVDAGKANAKLAKLDSEIEAAKLAGGRMAALREQRLYHYRAYFDALLEEERELHDLYAPLQKVLSGLGASVAKLQLSVRRVVDVEQWAYAGEQLLDLRVTGQFRGSGSLASVAEKELAEVWETGDGAAAAAAIDAFSGKYSRDIRNQSLVPTGNTPERHEWERAVARWLYGADHVRIRYSLEYDGLNIARLSPGSRGIVLLLLYLAVDHDETVPLIIDQPEENLDPESVYLELVQLFRKASQRRQVIMVTHNANLVVNTDVDQVIVAHCGPLAEGRLPDFTYVSGGLEQPKVRHAVCEILEGGAEAFRQRALRLRIRAAS